MGFYCLIFIWPANVKYAPQALVNEYLQAVYDGWCCFPRFASILQHQQTVGFKETHIKVSGDLWSREFKKPCFLRKAVSVFYFEKTCCFG